MIFGMGKWLEDGRSNDLMIEIWIIPMSIYCGQLKVISFGDSKIHLLGTCDMEAFRIIVTHGYVGTGAKSSPNPLLSDHSHSLDVDRN